MLVTRTAYDQFVQRLNEPAAFIPELAEFLANTRTVPTQLDKAYAAGILDGEGCITIPRHAHSAAHKRNPGHSLRIEVASIDRELIDWLAERWPATVSQNGPYKAHGPNAKPQYHFILTSKRAEKFIRDVLPFVVIKQRQCLLGLAFMMSHQGRGRNRLPAGIREYRQWLRENMQAANQRKVGVN